jgi:hypothetical protein
MFLAQMTKDAMTAARAHQEENAPKVEGKMINKWQVTNAVTQINKELHNGWQTFQFELNGTLYVWEYDEQSQRYMQR